MIAAPISAAPAVRWLLLPAALLLIFAFALPLALFFAQAFHAYSNGKVGADWTLATLSAFLTDPFHLETLYNSFYLAAIVTIICLLIAYPIALVMIRRRGTVLFTFLGIVIFSPVLVSIIVRAYGWQLLLANNGVVNSILLELGLVDRPVRLMFNWLGVIVSVVAFAVGHAPAQWLAAFAYGLIMAGLWIVRRDLLTPIVAHAVTNLVLYSYVFKTQSWGLW